MALVPRGTRKRLHNALYYDRFRPPAASRGGSGHRAGDAFIDAAGYVDRIFKGEKASELPVQFPVKFQMIVNLKTAKALDLDVPPLFQQRADEVIE